MKTNKDISTMIGRVLGICFIACLAACLGSIAIALTVRFIALLF